MILGEVLKLDAAIVYCIADVWHGAIPALRVRQAYDDTGSHVKNCYAKLVSKL